MWNRQTIFTAYQNRMSKWMIAFHAVFAPLFAVIMPFATALLILFAVKVAVYVCDRAG
jgi:hypothetical protein